MGVLMQVQAELGPGHINLINVYELILSEDYLGLVMEYAQGGSLTAHVAERWGTAKAGKLVSALLLQGKPLDLVTKFPEQHLLMSIDLHALACQ